jgi:hypothetical protein
VTGRCAYCGATLAVVHVHGHGQCARCGANVDPCCAGSGDEADIDGAVVQPVDPQLFARLFAHLGGPRATVARPALVYALAHRLGVGLEEAADVLDAGTQLGLVTMHGEGVRLGES